MSNPESFIEEVSEEVRRDRLYGTLRKYGWIGVLAVVLIVGGAAFNEYRKAQNKAAAEAYGDALYTALETDDVETRLTLLGEVQTPQAAAALTGLITATEMAARSEEEAVAVLQALIVNPDTPPLYRDLGRLRLALDGSGVLDTTERSAALNALIQGSGPFRLLALEQRALLEAENGEIDAAIATLQEVMRGAGATEAMQSRALQLIVALGGDVAQG
ncbi:MAG: tetratricopeptide repeat protein [Dinoroseobacter sp.]|nr:tetratricopeptide repeat protein [Dinoroseobacter sp.]